MESVSLALLLFIFFLLAGGIFHGVALFHDFFKLPRPFSIEAFPGQIVLFVVAVFFFFGKSLPLFLIRIIPSLFTLLEKWVSPPTLEMLLFSLKTLLNLFLIVLIGYCYDKKLLKKTLNIQLHNLKSHLKTGLFTFALAITSVTATGIILQLFTFWIFNRTGHEQSIITFLMENKQNQSVQVLGFLNIVFFAPTLEEFIFRGYIQNYLKKFFSRYQAIIYTSFLFAFVHFSFDQGLGNIALIGSIFLLSCYLGIAYEKTSSILSPILVHLLFNFYGIIRILI